MNRSIVWRAAAIALVGALAILSTEWALAQPLHERLSHGVALATAAVLRPLDLPAYVDGTTVYSLGYAVQVVPECNGLIGTSVVLAGVALLSLPWRRRLLLGALGLVAVAAVNLLRVTSVLVIGTRSASGADVIHEALFPLLYVVVFGYLWFVWLTREAAAVERPELA